VAEAKLLYYSYTRRDVTNTVQGLLLAEKAHLTGRRVFMAGWTRGDRFVLEHIVGGRAEVAPDAESFVRHARPGDFYISGPDSDHSELQQVRVNRRHKLGRWIE
jgi:hypothetical protein